MPHRRCKIFKAARSAFSKLSDFPLTLASVVFFLQCSPSFLIWAHFTSGSRDQKTLEANAKCILSVKKRKVHLNGHCDPRGTEEYNLALSNQRAQAVKRYLESLGVVAGRLHIVPKGELEATGTAEDSWFKDRKVEFVWY